MHLAALFLTIVASVPGDTVPDYETVYAELLRLAPRSDAVAAVSGLSIVRDVGRYTLADGVMYLLTPVAGRTVGAVFVGRGSVRVTPPLPVERRQLRRAVGADSVDRGFTTLVLLFADSTDAELHRRLAFTHGKPSDAAARSVRSAVEDLADQSARSFEPAMMTALLNGDANGAFHAYVTGGEGPPLLFSIDPYAAEQVSLRRRDGPREERLPLLCRFPVAGITPGAGDPAADAALVDVDRYTIQSRIAANLDFTADAEVTLVGKRAARWLPFQLFEDLRIDAVTDSAGSPIPFYRPKGGPELWVRLEPALDRGAARVIRIRYRGELLRRGSLMREILRSYRPSAEILQLGPADEWIFLRSPSYWYPRYGVAGGYGAFEAAVFDLTFQTPRKYRFASIGNLLEERTDGDVLTTRWATARPEAHAAFNIGMFEEFVVTDPRIPPVTVHMAMAAHRQLDEYFNAQQNPKQQVTTDLVNSLAFYTEVYGDPPFESFRATEIPGFYGQAFPGLIHLSWITYQRTGGRGQDETFRAHEMAHQWWGIAVDPLTYRDAWISEGFADFSGLWYMQTALGDNERYFETLKRWREQITARRREAGPLWLGTRLEEDYFLIVYRKGAWVLQMLRNMMIDMRTMDETPFKAMMRDFYQEYRGRRASTADFQAVVERHTGVSMEWFFDQWVRRSEIPTYVASWTAEPTADGRHRVRLRIRQEDVPEDFKMYVPVLLDFGETGSATVRVFVSGPQTEVTLPPVEAAPRRVMVNPLESVLAVVRTEGWR